MKLLASLATALLVLVACAAVSATPHEGHASMSNTDNSTTTTANTTNSTTNTPEIDPSSDIGTLLTALRAVGSFNILAGILAQYPEEIGKVVASDANVTLLAPNDAALGKINATLARTPRDALFALISYHVVLGNYPSSAFSAANHTVAPTLLSNSSYVNLGTDVPQVVVFSKNNAGTPVVVTNEGNVTFVKTDTDITTGKLSLYPITGVLSIPGNLSATLRATNFSTLNDGLAASNLSDSLSSSAPLTIFAPTNAAFNKAQSALQRAIPADRAAAFTGHILNGTVAYSSDLHKKAQAALADMSTMIDNSTHLVSTLIAAGGQAVNLTVSMDGTLSLVSGNYTAKIVSTDHLFDGGVVHGIDTVLLNSKTDPDAAAKAAANNSGATGTAASGGARGLQVNVTAVASLVMGFMIAAAISLVA